MLAVLFNGLARTWFQTDSSTNAMATERSGLNKAGWPAY